MGEIQGIDSCGTSSATEIAAALEDWSYSARPSETDALVDRLSAVFPTASVRRDGGATAAVLVDDVAVVAAHSLTPALRRDISALADRFGDVVVYSTTCHTAAPNEWREFKHRRSRGEAATIRFVERPPRTGGDHGVASARTFAALSIVLIGIASLLAASLGLFGTAGTAGATTAAAAMPGANALVVGGATVLGIAVAVGGYLLTRRRFYVALVARLTQ